MSLISDALRKARQEAVTRDRGGVIGPAYPPFRTSRLGTGLVLGALIAFAATLGGGAVSWWLLASRAPSGPRADHAGRAPTSGEPMGAEPSDATGDPATGARRPERGSASDPVSRAESETGPDGAVGESPAAGDVENSPVTVAETPEKEPVEASPRASVPAGERVFYVVADLGDRTLTLDYLVHRATDPFAQINGSDVHVGSTVAGCTVEAITADAVHLRDASGPIVLRAR